MEEIQSAGVFSRAFLFGLTPGEILTVSEWADKYRVLSEVAAAEPGRWRTQRTPYLREIMDVLSHHDPTQEIVFMKSAQIGGTECGLNWIAYIIDHAPGPTMLVQPTIDTAKRNSKQRITPLIDSSESLQEKVKPSRARDSGNTVLQKDFPGGTLIMAGANSAAGLRSVPIKYLFLDEVDAYEGDVEGEGDPVSLASARQRTFAKKKKFLVSTPTVESVSRIEPAYLKSDQRRFMVPCPHCGKHQELKFKNLEFKRENGVAVEAQYVCISCGVLIDEFHKTYMLENGYWEKQNPSSKIAGFHINALYSPLGWYSWLEIANDFLEAKTDENLLKTFVNTVLGETWKEKGDAPDWERLYERRTPRPKNIVPDEGLFLTCGVDVQQDRLELEVVAWGRHLRSWSIDYRVLMGDTSKPEVWDNLTELLYEEWPVDGTDLTLKIRAMGIDSGYNTQTVYNYVRRQDQSRVYATKGQETLPQILSTPRKVEVSYKGKRISRGINLWGIGTDLAKSELYGWLRQSAPKESDERPAIGYCDFPEYGEEFFKMLTAEEIFIRKIRGFPKRIWEKTRERNEALDCRVIARAMASLIGIDRFRDKNWEKLEKGRPRNDTNLKNPVRETSRKRTKIKRKKSDWL